MPSGITAPIYEGKEISLREYLLRCSRQMGACAHMRDEPIEAEPTFRATNVSYYYKRIEDYKLEIEQLETLDTATLQKRYDQNYEESVKFHEQRLAKGRELRQRYEEMASQVEEWMVPTEEHVYLKTFALQQLEASMNTDCNQGSFMEPERVDAEEERQHLLELYKRRIEDCEQEIKETKERDERHNAWIRELYSSLPTEEA